MGKSKSDKGKGPLVSSEESMEIAEASIGCNEEEEMERERKKTEKKEKKAKKAKKKRERAIDGGAGEIEEETNAENEAEAGAEDGDNGDKAARKKAKKEAKRLKALAKDSSASSTTTAAIATTSSPSNYIEHPDTTSLTSTEVSEYRASVGIAVYPDPQTSLLYKPILKFDYLQSSLQKHTPHIKVISKSQSRRFASVYEHTNTYT